MDASPPPGDAFRQLDSAFRPSVDAFRALRDITRQICGASLGFKGAFLPWGDVHPSLGDAFRRLDSAFRPSVDAFRWSVDAFRALRAITRQICGASLGFNGAFLP